MKIVVIFDDQLYSFVYHNETGIEYNDNEYDRLMELWTDIDYLRKYAIQNEVEDVDTFVQERLNDAETIQDLLEELTQKKYPLSHYFLPLFDQEIGVKLLSLRKGKTSRKDGLRLYAIEIDTNLYIITGGAIKMSQTMQEHPDTLNELKKIYKAKEYLKTNDVIDKESFCEFLNEQL